MGRTGGISAVSPAGGRVGEWQGIIPGRRRTAGSRTQLLGHRAGAKVCRVRRSPAGPCRAAQRAHGAGGWAARLPRDFAERHPGRGARLLSRSVVESPAQEAARDERFFSARCATNVAPGGSLHFWTDVEEYFHAGLEAVRESTSFEGPLAVAERPAEHDLDYRTHFEAAPGCMGKMSTGRNFASRRRDLWAPRCLARSPMCLANLLGRVDNRFRNIDG